MKFNAFVRRSLDFWTQYFNRLKSLVADGMVCSTGTLLYPTFALSSRFDGLLSFELLGASRHFSSLISKTHKIHSIDSYLSQFTFDANETSIPLLSFNGIRNGLINVLIGYPFDIETTQSRFPFIVLGGSRMIQHGGRGSLLGFGNSFRSCFLEDCILLNVKENITRCKYVTYLAIFARDIQEHELSEFYDKYMNQKIGQRDFKAVGIYTSPPGFDDDYILSAQLQSAFLSPGLHETTIGAFINAHPQIIKKAFDTDTYLYEPSFPWLEHDGTVTDAAINPDLMVQRRDGFYDIYDFKLAKLDKKNITRGERRRRGFISDVSEGIHQLANYREYFSYAKNAEYAKNKYGVVVNNPKLVLIAGNRENADPKEIQQASRAYDNVQVIDYDTLAMILLRPHPLRERE